MKALYFLLLSLTVALCASPPPFITSLLANRSAVMDNLEGREEVECTVPEGYYVFNVKPFLYDALFSLAGGVYLSKDGHACKMRIGVMSVCDKVTSCLATRFSSPASSTGVQMYQADYLSVFLLGTTYTDTIPVFVKDGSCASSNYYSGEIVRTYLRDDDDADAFDAIRKDTTSCEF